MHSCPEEAKLIDTLPCKAALSDPNESTELIWILLSVPVVMNWPDPSMVFDIIPLPFFLLTVLTTDCDAKQCWNDWKKCEEETAYLKLVIRSLELPQNTKDLEFNVFESESYRIEAKKDDILSKLLTPFNITAKEEDMKLSLKMLLDYTDALDLQEHIPVILKELAQNNVCPWDLMFVGRGYIPRLRKVDTCKYEFEWSN